MNKKAYLLTQKGLRNYRWIGTCTNCHFIEFDESDLVNQKKFSVNENFSEIGMWLAFCIGLSVQLLPNKMRIYGSESEQCSLRRSNNNLNFLRFTQKREDRFLFLANLISFCNDGLENTKLQELSVLQESGLFNFQQEEKMSSMHSSN